MQLRALFRDRCVDHAAPIAAQRLRCSSTVGGAEGCVSTVTCSSDTSIAQEVNRHVEAESDGMDITSGLWLDHPQVGVNLFWILEVTSFSASVFMFSWCAEHPRLLVLFAFVTRIFCPYYNLCCIAHEAQIVQLFSRPICFVVTISRHAMTSDARHRSLCRVRVVTTTYTNNPWHPR